MKLYYIIYVPVETEEYEVCAARRICESYEEAKSHIMEYPFCYIDEKDEECNVLQTWFFQNGEQTSYLDGSWGK